jgi:ABC-type Zn2+ transport system substrate-binding protein/surface adhesin
MDAQDWADLATVFRAGADRSRDWTMNTERQQNAEILDAQADRCEEIARDRAGNPPVTHTHYHGYIEDGRPLKHRHEHSHADGETDHDHYHEPVRSWGGN